jgi:hypothetical protein
VLRSLLEDCAGVPSIVARRYLLRLLFWVKRSQSWECIDLSNVDMQVLTIIAMEKPVTTSADDIRDEKVKVMKSIPPIKLDGVCALL